MTALCVALGAAVGAAIRLVAGDRLDDVTPWGTLLVNVGGSGALGALSGATLSGDVFAALGTGLCGALTTWSALAVQTVDLARCRGVGHAAAYVLGTIALAVGACGLGFWLAA